MAHCIDVNALAVPEYNCICGFVKFAPNELIAMVLIVFAAVNLYQTSQWFPATSQPAGNAKVLVAVNNEPAVLEQIDVGVSAAADAGSSFGELCKQMVKPRLFPGLPVGLAVT